MIRAILILIFMSSGLSSSGNNKSINDNNAIVPNKKTQVRIVNDSDQYRQIRLWGGNLDVPICVPNTNNVEDLVIEQMVNVPALGGSGRIVYNPFNGLLYLINNTGDVLLYDGEGVFITSIALPVGSIPSDLTILTDANNVNYGRAYVSNLVTNSVTVIETNLTVLVNIGVGTAPSSLAIDNNTNRLYVSNSNSNSVSAIDLASNVNTGAFMAVNPGILTVNSNNGDVYVTSSPNIVRVYNSAMVFITDIMLSDNFISGIIYNPANNQIYVTTLGTSVLTPIDTNSYSTLPVIPIGGFPNALRFNRNNNLVIVITSGDNRYVGVDVDNTVTGFINLHSLSGGLAINGDDNVIWTTDVLSDTLFRVGFPETCTDVAVDNDYLEKVENFKYNPAKVSGIRFAFSTSDTFNTLAFRKETANGTITQETLSMGDYISPQHFQPVIDLYGLSDVQIDGQRSWLFMIAPMQVITVLVHYKQFFRTV